MADISKMGNMYRNLSTEFGALVSIKLSFFPKGKRRKAPGDDHSSFPTPNPEEGEEVV